MAKQALTRGAVAKAVRWSHVQEVTFDDFFGKKLSYEGFTIERIAGGYQVSSNPTETFMAQKAKLVNTVGEVLTKR
jgi:hypothetical protein